MATVYMKKDLHSDVRKQYARLRKREKDDRRNLQMLEPISATVGRIAFCFVKE